MHLLSPEIDTNQKNGLFSIDFILRKVQPPVYIAGSFTNPKWKPTEMKYTELEDTGEYKFWLDIHLSKDQEYQYKFRIGERDWVLNEDEPTATDAAGNRNNVLSAYSNINEWSEMARTDRSEDVWEERRLTKYVTEKRRKDFGVPLVEFTQSLWSHRAQTTKDHNSKSAIPSVEDKQDCEVLRNSESIDNSSIKPPELHIKIGPTKNSQLNAEFPSEPAPTPAIGINRSHGSIEIPTQKPNSHKTLPTVGIAKVDAQRSDREFFEVDATHDLNVLHAINSENDVTPNQNSILDIANTADEVAKVAAALDEELPTPPISDEEAGRVGFRRLSMTPIPQVAEVAAEVADTAAELDKNLQFSDGVNGNDFESRRMTPPNERVPRFSFELPLLRIPSQSHSNHSENINEIIPQIEDDQIPENIDLNDPSIQYFPTEPAKILAKLAEIQERLPEDKAHFEGAQLSPVFMPNNWGFPSQMERSSIPVNQQPSSSLQPISEEDNQNSDNLAEGDKMRPYIQGVTSELEVEVKEQNQKQKAPERTGDHQVTGSSLEDLITGKDGISSDESVNSSSNKMKTPIQTTNDEAREKSQNQNNGSMYDTTVSNKFQTQPSAENDTGFDSETPNSNSFLAPSAAHQREDGANDEIKLDNKSIETRKTQASDTSNSPVIPEESFDINSRTSLKPNGEANSSGIADDTTQEPILRRSTKKISQQRWKSPDRSLSRTPNPSGNEVQRRGFVKAFFQIVIVDWIGGFIGRLFSVFKRHT